MSSSTMKEIEMTSEEYDAITNPENPKNKAAMARARKNFSKVSKYKGLTIGGSEEKQTDYRKRLDTLYGILKS